MRSLLRKLRTRQRRKTDRRQSGFTLIEALVAISILAAGLLGVAQLFVIAINQNAFARNNTMGTTLALDRLEDLKNRFNREIATGTPDADLTPGAHGPVNVTVKAPTGTRGGDFVFAVRWNVEVVGVNKKQIAILVDALATNTLRNRTISMMSYLAP